MTPEEAVKAGAFPWEPDGPLGFKLASADGGQATAGLISWRPSFYAGRAPQIRWAVFSRAATVLAEGQSRDAELAVACAEHAFKLLVQRAVDEEAETGG